MKLSPIHSRSSRWSVLVMFSLAVFVIAGAVGCDNPEVQTVLLGGIQELAVTLIDAFFITLEPIEEATPTTVSWLMESANALMC